VITPKSALWAARPEFEADRANERDVANLNWALKLQDGVETAEASLIDRGTGLSLSATIIMSAATPGGAADAAVYAFQLAARDGGITLGSLREVAVQPAALDPRS